MKGEGGIWVRGSVGCGEGIDRSKGMDELKLLESGACMMQEGNVNKCC